MIFVNIDISPIIAMSKDFRSSVDRAMQNAVRDLTVMTHAHIVEQAQAKLHSTRQKYIDALSFSQVDADTWLIELGKDALFIEEGIKPNTDMLKGLLGSSKAKTARDGSRYLVVPFEHKKGASSQTPAQTSLTDTIKAEMKKRNIPYGGIEKGPDGKPKLGKLHSFDILRDPVKTHHGPGQGHGKIGDVRQGTTGIPFLQGVRVSQSMVKDKSGKSSVKKSITTFRVASSKHVGSGKWLHPGLTARKLMDEAVSWALSQWELHIRDQILVEISGSF